MKITMEVDCSPEEARDFMGLPDLKPLQANVLARVEQQLLEAASALSPEGVLKTWFTLLPQASDRYVNAMANLLKVRPSGESDVH